MLDDPILQEWKDSCEWWRADQRAPHPCYWRHSGRQVGADTCSHPGWQAAGPTPLRRINGQSKYNVTVSWFLTVILKSICPLNYNQLNTTRHKVSEQSLSTYLRCIKTCFVGWKLNVKVPLRNLILKRYSVKIWSKPLKGKDIKKVRVFCAPDDESGVP